MRRAKETSRVPFWARLPKFRPPSPRPAVGPIEPLIPWVPLQIAAGSTNRNEWSYTSTLPILLRVVPVYNSYRFSGIGAYC